MHHHPLTALHHITSRHVIPSFRSPHHTQHVTLTTYLHPLSHPVHTSPTSPHHTTSPPAPQFPQSITTTFLPHSNPDHSHTFTPTHYQASRSDTITPFRDFIIQSPDFLMVLAVEFLKQLEAPLPVSVLSAGKQDASSHVGGGTGTGTGTGTGGSDQQQVIPSYCCCCY